MTGSAEQFRSGLWAIVVAAGSGERLGLDRPKAFARLGDRPLLAESLERLDQSGWIDAIVIVAPPGWEEPSILLAEELGCAKANACVAGGRTRVESVRAGMAEVPQDAIAVLIHDAARPLLPEAVIERVVVGLGDGFEGVVPALPIADTVKRTRGEEVTETVDREGLVTVQTPQAFSAAALRDALAGEISIEATDCAAVVEAHGGRIRTVAGDRRLVKVTTREDLALVERLL